MKVYLDIDGVLLTKDQKVPCFASDLIKYLIGAYDTHCRNGENKAVEYLKRFYGKEFIFLFEKEQPSYWNDLKTEGIDFSSEFIWLEDYPFEAEKRILVEEGKLGSLIVVDLRNENELIMIKEK